MLNLPFCLSFEGNEVKRYAPGSYGFVGDGELARYPELRVPEINSAFLPAWWYEKSELTRLKPENAAVFALPGADALPEDMRYRTLPLWFKADTGPGRYKLTLELAARSDCCEVLVFTSRRRLAWAGQLRAGETKTVEALCDVSPIVAVGGGDAAVSDKGRVEDNSVDVAVLGAGIRALRIEPYEGRAVFIMGDSTVTDQPAETPYAPGAAYCGWGQMLQVYLGTGLVVSNHAHSGLSTETFRDKGHYDVMLPQVKAGDYVLIQFGHNDQKRLHLAAETGYTENLLRYIKELRALGARPVLVTSLARNTWKSPTEYNDLLKRWADAAIKLGERENVPVVDLHGRMMEKILSAGMEDAKKWYHPGDYAHPNDFGAYMAAGFVAEGLRDAGLIPGFSVPGWPIHPPMTPLAPPPEPGRHGNTPPGETRELVDYGLIPDSPWPIT